MKLNRLIEESRGETSFARLSARSGGLIATPTLHRLATKDELDRSVDADTVRGLARIFSYAEWLVWDSVGESLGLAVRDDAALAAAGRMPPGWEHLGGDSFEELRAHAASLISREQAMRRIEELEAHVAELEAAAAPVATKAVRSRR